jgi:hypothetical protein
MCFGHVKDCASILQVLGFSLAVSLVAVERC